MNMHSLLQKVFEMTNPTRFLSPKSKNAHAPFVGRNFVVTESFWLFSKGAPVDSRRALKQYVATPAAPSPECIVLEIGAPTADAGADWTVRLEQGHTELVAAAGEPAKMISLYKRLYAQLIRDDQAHAQSQVGLLRGAVVLLGVIALYAALAIVGGLSGASKQQSMAHLGGASAGLTPEQIAYMTAASAQQTLPPNFARAPGAPSAPGAMPPAVQTNPQGERLSDAESKALAAKSAKIAMGGAGGQVTIFTDPKCPFCQRLEESIEEVVKDGKAKPVLVPVAFKDGSRSLIASVFCAKDPAAAWKKAVRTGEPAGPVCEAGLKKVDQNNKLFDELRLSATPTMLSPKGLVAAGFATAADLTLFAQH